MLQMVIFTAKLTHPIRLACSFRSSFIKNAPLSSFGAVSASGDCAAEEGGGKGEAGEGE